jgi:ABC-type polysaccharide transport system permease subunit
MEFYFKNWVQLLCDLTRWFLVVPPKEKFAIVGLLVGYYVSKGIAISFRNCYLLCKKIITKVTCQVPPFLTWQIYQIIVDCFFPIVP